MPAFSLQDQYTLSKGPLSNDEMVLKDILLRDTYYKVPNAALGNATVPSGGLSTNPSAAPSQGLSDATSGEKIEALKLVKPGDLIEADYINDIVRRLNQVVEYLAKRTREEQKAPSAPAASGTTGGTAGIVGLLKDVTLSQVDTEDKVTVTFPAGTAQPSDFSDLLVGTARVDPADLVKVGDSYAFKVNKDLVTSGADVRAVSKAGTSAQQVLGLFR